MKKTLSITLAIIMIFSMFALGGVTSTAANLDQEGNCGEGMEWYYSDMQKHLYISGDGEMYDYTEGNRPWESFVDKIQYVHISEATHIGSYAFAGMTNLREVNFSNYTLTIGEGAFKSCENLKYIDASGYLVAIAPSAFEGCTSLRRITLGRHITYIGDNAFAGCPIEYTIYQGTPEQKDLILFEDETESLPNVFYGDTIYDISVNKDEYQVLSVVSDRPFTLTIKDKNVAEIIETAYETVEEDGVLYYVGAAAVLGKGEGKTTVYAVDENNTIIGIFSVISGPCASNHNFSAQMSDIEIVDDSTCDYVGFEVKRCMRCSDCGVSYIRRKNHDITYTTVEEPTCDNGGMAIGKCEDCGSEFEKALPPLHHNWTEWVITVAPTTEADGEKKRQCTLCGEVEVDIAPRISTVIGDANGDGKLTAMDARWVLQYAAEMRTLDEHQFKLADVNNDGKVSAIDARKILQMVANQV